MQKVRIILAIVIVDVVVAAEFVICIFVIVADSIVLWHLRCLCYVSTEIAYFGGWKMSILLLGDTSHPTFSAKFCDLYSSIYGAFVLSPCQCRGSLHMASQTSSHVWTTQPGVIVCMLYCAVSPCCNWRSQISGSRSARDLWSVKDIETSVLSLPTSTLTDIGRSQTAQTNMPRHS